MTKYRVLIPDEHYSILEFEDENLPGIAVVNTALKGFEPKEVFCWQLSIIIDLQDLIENGMPSAKEVQVIDEFGDYLDKEIKGAEEGKPNALFLARVTWNSTRQLIWRVYNPEISHHFLQYIIAENSSPRSFDYRIDKDEDWGFTDWYLSEWK